MRKVYLLGGANTKFIGKFHPEFIWKKHPEYGERENPTLEEHLENAVNMALEKTQVSPETIERGFVGNFAGELFSNQAHLGSVMAGINESFAYKPFMRTEGACASGGLAIMCGIDSIKAGCDVVMAAGTEVQTTVSARQGADYLARAAHYRTQRDIDDFTFPCLFARRTKHVLEETDITREDLARLVAKAYSNGNKNPKAHMQAVKVSLEDALESGDKNPNFLQNEDYKPYLKVKDCSQVSDGASALILASEEGLRKLGKSHEDAVEIIGYSYGAAPIDSVPDFTSLTTVTNVAQLAYEMAELSPREIQVAEVHDCFAVAEALMYEALGFGKATELIREGKTHIDGEIPVNTGGGLMAFGHPVGATGVKQAVEIYRQLKGEAGAYQVPSRPEIGLSANMGGDDKTVVVTIYKNAG